MTECKKDSDENRLIREGTTQEERFPAALDPAYAPVDDWKIEHGILFAKAYAKFLKYYDAGNREAGDWQPFFSKDVSALLVVMTMQDVEECRENIKGYIKTLNDKIKTQIEKKEALGKIINSMGSLAKQIDIFKEGLPDEYPLKAILCNLVRNRLDDDFKELILCCRDCFGTDVFSLKKCNPSFKVIRSESCADLLTLLEDHTFSVDWIPETKTPEDKKETWIEYLRDLYEQPEKSSLTADEEGINKLFEISNRFLMAYARTVTEARRAFEDSLKKWNRHEPHYALFLAFLRLMEHARNELNTLTGRHLDFYYREILQFKEKEVVPPKAHVLVELAKQVPSYLIKAGEEFKAGKDDLGKDVFFASERDFLANRAKVAALKTVYRHGNEQVAEESAPDAHKGRLFASSVANSSDGLGGELVSEDKSWHPLFNKTYQKDKLLRIEMPKAEVGFAIASHYLWMAGGKRTITTTFSRELDADFGSNKDIAVDCYLTGEKEWIKKEVKISFIPEAKDVTITIELSGRDPAVVPYSSKIHGYNFQTELPVLRVELTHKDEETYSYDILSSLEFQQINLSVNVCGLKPLAVSNDFGPVDISKPFQPFGPSPVKGNALVIGVKEIFQKRQVECINVNINWQKEVSLFEDKINIEYLQTGLWHPISCKCQENEKSISIFGTIEKSEKDKTDFYHIDKLDFSTQGHIDAVSINGFVKIKLNEKFINQVESCNNDIESCLDLTKYKTLQEQIACLLKLAGKRTEPSLVITELTIDYKATATIDYKSTTNNTETSQAAFFHIITFGCSEQHPYLKSIQKEKNVEFDEKIYLLPQFKHIQKKFSEITYVKHEAEFYIGITDLKPPKNLSLLFQVADGTANPEKEKPKHPHIHWSYLRNNEWISFLSNAVEDYTDELITSGIITFVVPRDASDDNTLLPAGMHWIRAAVSSAPDAVCKLRMVEAQAVKVKFVDKENDPNFSAKTLLKDSITKLARPAAEVKKITQPFPSYGGRGKESSKAFYTRVSERLRHKDRAITLWDYERLILEAFPEVHKVKCLNHTRYEFDQEEDKHVYNPMAPGHVTVVTIANQEHHRLPDRLRPNVSLGLQKKIEEFLRPKLSSFVKLHVVNPKFEEIKVNFRVKLHQGVDETYSINTLQEAIVSFLSPWAFSGKGGPSFSGKIYKSALINFIEEQDCVDYLTCFKLMHLGVGNQEHDEEDHEEVQGYSSISILVSVPIGGHKITPIPSFEDGKYINENSPC